MILHKKLLIEVFILTVVIAFLHYVALRYSLYFLFDWFDIVMHFLGGLWAALFVLFVTYSLGWINLPKCHTASMVLITLGAVLVIGLAWELWELFSGLSFVFKDKADTLLDLVMDMIGGSVGLWYGIQRLCHKEN